MRALWPNFDEYSPVRLLASTQATQVYEGKGPGGRACIIKAVMMPEAPVPGQTNFNRLLVAESAKHPNLLPVRLSQWLGGGLCLVQDLANRSIWEEFRDARLKGKKGLSKERLCKILYGIAEALDFLHLKHRVVHGAVKPENILHFDDGWKLSDLSLRGSNKQSPWCTAPEVVVGAPCYASDQFSLAVVYAEMRTGRLPFLVTSSTDISVQVGFREPILVGVDVLERGALRRALSFDSNHRFPTCVAMLDALTGEGDLESPSDHLELTAEEEAPTDEVTVKRDDVEFLEAVNGVGEDAGGVAKDDKESEHTPRFMLEASVVRRLDPTHWHIQGDRRHILNALEEYARAREIRMLHDGRGRLRLEVNAPGENVNENPLTLTFELLERRDKQLGWMAVVGVEHVDSPLSESEFEEASSMLLDDLSTQLKLQFAADAPTRREERKAVRASVAIVPRTGAYKHMKVTCTAIDYSRHGLGVAAQFPLSAAAADLFLKAREEPIAVRIVNLRPQVGVDGYVVGLTTEDGKPLPEDVLRELAAAERDERK
jgi:serine/threonine protein kinase